MVFKVTYYDENGYPLQEATFNSDTIREMLGHMATVPTLQPPDGTVRVGVELVPVP